MQVTLVVGNVERELGDDTVASGAAWVQAPPPGTDDAPLAADERELLDELTRLCRGILIEDAPPAQPG